MEWETVIGLETHVELSTRTKIFCACPTAFGGAPNTRCCPVCTGMPGALPVLNRRVLEYAAKVSLALGCTVTRQCRFDRKNYFYPDLPKAYQISQLYLPIGRDGRLTIPVRDGEKTIRIHELHMEEDAGKLIHDPQNALTRVDYNRCGVPLIEIVTQPDFRSGEEVVAYLEKLRSILRYLEVSDCRMEEGSLRCDVNLSLRPKGTQALGTRTEMKNLGSLRSIARAIRYEAGRQRELLETGRGKVMQQTLRWDEDREISLPMRSKEDEQDYRYFPEPDLPPVELTQEELAVLEASLPELAESRKKRYIRDYGLPEYDAGIITGSKTLAEFYERAVSLGADPREGAKWILSDLLRLMKERRCEPEEIPLAPESFTAVVDMVLGGRLNRGTASKVLEAAFVHNVDPEDYVREHGLEQICDSTLVEQAVDGVLNRESARVEEYRAGKEKLYGFFVGECMRALKGKADPKTVHRVLQARLKGG